ncbi:hypothetical protein [Bacillus sp. 165]|uniref:hypothetical protein n=1 Tax=Bacillus sp. 165 TaxID=1529117 RepID=UPI001ADB71EB|nr:hypothetical protein [Bacillus sp. 165]MBO9128404.1 hypothetical protein [Bacillus sp. 165]
MQMNTNDLAVVEQALKSALANSSDYQEIYQYQDLLEKLTNKNSQARNVQADGLRYDYDDSSNL